MSNGGGPAPSGGFSFNGPTIVALCYLGSCITGISAIVGLVLAYLWRSEARAPWEQSHFTFMIRTFWIGLVVSIAGGVLLIVGVGLLILLGVMVWMIVRTVVSLVKAQREEPMPDPQSWMI